MQKQLLLVYFMNLLNKLIFGTQFILKIMMAFLYMTFISIAAHYMAREGTMTVTYALQFADFWSYVIIVKTCLDLYGMIKENWIDAGADKNDN